MTNLGRIKGAAFGGFLTWYEQRFGRVGVYQVLSEIVRRHGLDLDPSGPNFGVLPSTWYPAVIVHELLDGLQRSFDPTAIDATVLDAAEFVMQRNLRGVYRAVFSLMMTPERYAKYVDRLWALHYDTGRPIVTVRNRNLHEAVFHDWHGHHPFICRLNMAAAVPIYRAMGCRGVSHQRKACVSLGDDVCINVVQWE